MSQIDIDLEKKHEDVIEGIYRLIYSERTSTYKTEYLDSFEKTVRELDKRLRLMHSPLQAQVYDKILEQTVTRFLNYFKQEGLKQEPLFFAFHRYLKFFIETLTWATKVPARFISMNFYSNFPILQKELAVGPLDDFPYRFCRQIGVRWNDYDYDFNQDLTIFGDDTKVRKIIYDNKKELYVIVDESLYMLMTLHVSNEEDSASRLFSPMWLMTTALESIENVTTEIFEISKGSLRTTILLWIKDVLAKEEVKNILETAKEYAVKIITAGQVSQTEVKKTREEIKNLKLENRKIELELSQMPSDTEAKIQRALDIQAKILQNELLQIEVNKARIELANKNVDMVSKAMTESDQFRIEIDDIIFFDKTSDATSSGPEIK